MHKLLPLLLLLLPSCLGASSINAYLGERAFVDSDIEDVDSQPYVGADVVWGVLPGGLGIETGIGWSKDDEDTGNGGSTELATLEGYVGARYTFNREGSFQPYIGAGVTAIATNVTIEEEGEDDLEEDDFAKALYARVGLAYHFTLLRLGVDYRQSLAGQFDYGDGEVDSDSGVLSVFLGISL